MNSAEFLAHLKAESRRRDAEIWEEGALTALETEFSAESAKTILEQIKHHNPYRKEEA